MIFSGVKMLIFCNNQVVFINLAQKVKNTPVDKRGYNK